MTQWWKPNAYAYHSLHASYATSQAAYKELVEKYTAAKAERDKAQKELSMALDILDTHELGYPLNWRQRQ